MRAPRPPHATAGRLAKPNTLSRQILLGLALSLSVTIAGASGTFAAQVKSAPPSVDPQNLEGVWIQGKGGPQIGGASLLQSAKDLPFTAEGLAAYNYRRAMSLAGTPLQDPAGECMPEGLPRAISAHHPFQVIQTPEKIVIVAEMLREFRIIYMNKNHPKPSELKPSFMGHSVGHWEGETLVVDTVGLLEVRTQWDWAPISEQVHVIERYRKIDGGKHLEDVVTVDDPKNYTQSWTARVSYNWDPKDSVEEYVCEESPERPSNLPDSKVHPGNLPDPKAP